MTTEVPAPWTPKDPNEGIDPASCMIPGSVELLREATTNGMLKASPTSLSSRKDRLDPAKDHDSWVKELRKRSQWSVEASLRGMITRSRRASNR